MSFKSLVIKSKYFKKTVACTFTATMSVCAISYSGHNRYKEMATADAPAYVVVNPLVSEGLVCSSFAHPTSTPLAATTFTTTSTTTATTIETTTLSTTSVVTSTTTLEVTTSVTEAPTEKVFETSAETTEPDTPIEAETIVETPREYVVYKPSTHYIHTSTCRWYNSECYEISSTEGIEARKCTECNPDIEIITPYTEPTPPAPTYTETAIAVSDYEYVMLCNLVAGEYGSDWVSIYDKGAVVATVIHRMWEGTRWTNGAPATIYNVIAAPYQYDGKYLSTSYSPRVTQSCKDAVTYALNNMSTYDYYTNPDGNCVYMINSFCGDGRYNWFRHS